MKICIDAGHGGTDGGADGPTGLNEAPVVLSICQILGKLLETVGFQVLLTRDKDEFVQLGARAEAANEWGANVFVSVHCNSDGPSAHGAETLYKSQAGKAIAEPIQKELVEQLGEHNRGVKRRDDLAVLNMTRMPAVLAEVGFISNPETEKKMRGHEYLNRIAWAIAKGLQNAVGIVKPLDSPTAPPP